MPYDEPNLDHDTVPVSPEVFLDFKRRFPEIPENLIVELINQFSGNIQQLTKELTRTSNSFMYGGERPDDFLNNQSQYPMKNMTSTSPSSSLHDLPNCGSESSQYNNPGMMKKASFSSAKTGSNSNDLSREHAAVFSSAFSAVGCQDIYSTTSENTESPASLFLQRRTTSDDSMQYSRQMSNVRRDRSASDLSELRMNNRGNNFVPPMASGFNPTWQANVPQVSARGNEFDQAAQTSNQQQLMQEQKHRESQNIQLQLESCTRLQTKVQRLREEVERIRCQVVQEENDIDTCSKIQRNPTEKDVLKLSEENEILKKEILEADTALQKIKAGQILDRDPTVSSVPVIDPQDHSATYVSPLQPSGPSQNVAELMMSATPHMSYPRFPHPVVQGEISSPHSPYPAVRSETPPPDYFSVTEGDQWQCAVCTFQNHVELLDCEMCNSKKQ
eukprot:gene655-1323_t